MAEEKKISRIYIEYPEGQGEYATISIPISEVEGLEERLSWTVVSSPSTSKEEKTE